ncbi:MAG: dienelactone hydrolase family protein [Rhodospirillales bacterium]|nr:dienelactone hydrolase family protein [Rhodospirillales bacterium]
MYETVSRRDVVKGIASGVPLAAVLADPELARAAASGLEMVSLTTAGGRSVSGALAMPSGKIKAGVLLIHEWWGLNDQIKSVAAELANQGYMALAVDLFEGKVASNADEARAYSGGTDPVAATDTVKSWVEWLRSHEKGTGKVGTVGWCFGGGWSLNVSLVSKVDATVIYYGRVNKKAHELAALKGPVLGHFGTLDKYINEEMVGGFELAMSKSGKRFTTHWYEANHAFANPTGNSYAEGDAKLAWERTLAFFEKYL